MFVPFWQIMAQTPRLETWPALSRRARAPLTLVPRRNDAVRTTKTTLTVDFVDLPGAEAVRDEWHALQAHALEPNIFMDPDFALAAAQHFAEAHRPSFVLIRDHSCGGPGGSLLGVWPVETKRAAWSPAFVKGWQSPHAVLGTPLIDRFRAAEVADAVLDALARRAGSRSLLLVPQLLRAGPTYGLLLSRALATGRAWGSLSPHARAVLRSGASAEVPRAKYRKNLARQRRQLEERGTLRYRSAESADEIRAATEQFLVLEQSGWKGRRATALLSEPGSVTFARSMIRLLARNKLCRIDSLELDGNPVAMGIVLNRDGRAYFWKTAFDEALARFSPGVLLTLDLTRRQLADTSILVTDSCAIAGHPMIERVWPKREHIVDLAIAITPGTHASAHKALRRERLRRDLRGWLKKAVGAVRNRRQTLRILSPGENAPTS